MVIAVDDRDIDVGGAQGLGRIQPAKPAPRMMTFGRDLELWESIIRSASESTIHNGL